MFITVYLLSSQMKLITQWGKIITPELWTYPIQHDAKILTTQKEDHETKNKSHGNNLRAKDPN
jgi:hypothetical protein